jgi:hypothetical protein
MNAESRRVCPSCGNEFSGAVEFCPACMLRGALAPKTESDVSALGEAPVELLKVIPTVRDAIDAGCHNENDPRFRLLYWRRPKGAASGGSSNALDRCGVRPSGERHLFDLPNAWQKKKLGGNRESPSVGSMSLFFGISEVSTGRGIPGQIPNTAEFAQRRETAFLLKAEEADGCLRSGEKSFPTPTKIDVPWLRHVNKVQTSQHWK